LQRKEKNAQSTFTAFSGGQKTLSRNGAHKVGSSRVPSSLCHRFQVQVAVNHDPSSYNSNPTVSTILNSITNYPICNLNTFQQLTG